MLSELRPNGVAQLNQFDDEAPRLGSEALMSLMDKMNRFGRYSIGFAGKGIQPKWWMKRDMLSKAWTTNWKEIPVVRIC
jgi:DNA polymerase V